MNRSTLALLACLLATACPGELDTPAPPRPVPQAQVTTWPELPQLRQVEEILEEANRQADRVDMAQFDKAEVMLHEVLEEHPCHPFLLTRLGGFELTRFAMSSRVGHQLERPKQALSWYEKALECAPGHLGALTGIADYYQQFGEHQRAIEIYGELAAENPDDPIWLYKIASVQEEHQEYPKAIENGQQALAMMDRTGIQGERMNLLFVLGQAYTAERRYDEAEAAFVESRALLEESTKRDPGGFTSCPYTGLGELYQMRGQHAAAAEMYGLIADHESYRTDGFFQFKAAESAHNAGYSVLAQHYIQRAITLADRPEYGQLAARLEGDLHQQHGVERGQKPGDPVILAEAITAFQGYSFRQATVLLDEVHSAELSERGRVLQAFLLVLAADYQGAEAQLAALSAGSPEADAARVARAHLAVTQHDTDSALAQLGPALARLESSVPGSSSGATDRAWHALQLRMARLGQAWSHSNQGDHERAVLAYDQVLGGEPRDTFALLGKGNSLTALGELDQAQALFEQILESDPDNQYALAGLALTALNKGDDAAAEAAFSRALQIAPEGYTCPHEGLGMVYLRQGREAEARSHFERAIEINPNIEYKKYNELARMQMDDGLFDDAEALLRKSIENYPHDGEAQRLLEELQQRRSAATPPAQ